MNKLYYRDNLDILRQRVAVFVFSKRSFTKILAIEIVLLFFIISGHGQNVSHKDCELGLAASPALRGMKLGMSVAQVEKELGFKLVFGPSTTRPFLYENEDKDLQAKIRKMEIEKVDQSVLFPFWPKMKDSVGIWPEYEEVPKIDGVSSFLLSFYQNSLYSINIMYEEKSLEWKGSREFALILSEKFTLPAEFWRTDDVRSTSLILNEPYEDESTMFCRDFILTAMAKGIHSKISIFDQKTSRVVREKQEHAAGQAIYRELKRMKDAEAAEKAKQAIEAGEKAKQAIEQEVKQIKDIEKKRNIRP